jgi:hypothetical protein
MLGRQALWEFHRGLTLRFARTPAPARSRLDQAENHQAKPEIDNDSQIEAHGYVTRSNWQVGHEQKVGDVSHNNRDQGLHEIHHHWVLTPGSPK